MSGIVLMARQNDRNHQGDIREYVLETSDAGEQWLEVDRGELASTWRPQKILFDAPLTTKHLRLTARSGFGEDPSAAIAELAVIHTGLRLEDSDPGTIEYRRSRSTSTDVEEGD